MSTADRVQATIMDELLHGKLTPGTFIRQDDTAQRLGVSKIPVREALMRLEAIGLLRLEPNRGAVVPELDVEQAHECYALRRDVEKRLLERAVPRLNAVDLATAELELGPTEAPTPANWRFHRALYSASGWNRCISFVEVLHASVAPYAPLYSSEFAAQTDREHNELLSACREGEVDTAVGILDAHLRNARDALVAHLTAHRLPTDQSSTR